MTSIKDITAVKEPSLLTKFKNVPDLQVLQKLLTNTDLQEEDADLEVLEELFFTKVPVKSSLPSNPSGTTRKAAASPKINLRCNSPEINQTDYDKFAQESKLFQLLTSEDELLSAELKREKRYSRQNEGKGDLLASPLEGSASTYSNDKPISDKNKVLSHLLSLPAKSPQLYQQTERVLTKSNVTSKQKDSPVLRQLICSPALDIYHHKVNNKSSVNFIDRKMDGKMSESLKSVKDSNQVTSSVIITKPGDETAENSSEKSLLSYLIQKTDISPIKEHGHGIEHTVLHQCDLCNQVFPSWPLLQKHKKSHSKDQIYCCEVCKEYFTSSDELQDHVKIHLEGFEPSICDYCHSSFQDVRAFIEHNCLPIEKTSEEGESDQMHECMTCFKKFPTEESCNEHIKSHDDKRFGCVRCKSRFSSTKALKIHMKCHLRNKLHRCIKCNITFNRKRELIRHQRKHMNKGSYTCPICSKTFKFERKFDNHMAQHKGFQFFTCEKCDTPFVTSRDLANHKSCVHADEKKFTCQECGKSFSYSGNLATHMRTHFEEDPYECDQCGQRFKKRTKLAAHKETHTEKVLYKCRHCGRICPTHRHLLRHARCHSAIKPFKCEECHKCFRERHKLRMHQMTHTGEKPYKCDLCDKRFVHKSSITQHAKVHAANKAYSCGMCARFFTSSREFLVHISTHSRGSALEESDDKIDAIKDSSSASFDKDIGNCDTREENIDIAEGSAPGIRLSSSDASAPIFPNIKIKQEPEEDYEAEEQQQSTVGSHSKTGSRVGNDENDIQKWTVFDSTYISPV